MENKDDDNQELLPVEIEENQSYLLSFEKNNTKEDAIVLILSFFLIKAHILNCFFNPTINLNHTQIIDISQFSNFNNITATYQIANIKPANLFLVIGFLFTKNNIDKESNALINLTTLINASYNSQQIFEKGDHKLNLHFNSRKNRKSSNFYQFFYSNRINFDSFRLIFAAKGIFDDFTKCLIEIFYFNPIFTYFVFFTFTVTILVLIILIFVYIFKTYKIKGKNNYRSEFVFVISLHIFSLFYTITNLIEFDNNTIFFKIQFLMSSFFTSCFFTTIIFFRNLNYPFNTKIDFSLSFLVFSIYLCINFFSLTVHISTLSTISYFLRILFSVMSLITTVKYEKASLKEYGNNLLFFSGFILVFGFASNNEKLILLSQKFYNKFMDKILTSQTMLAYSLSITYILFPVPQEKERLNDRQKSTKLENCIEESDK